MQPVSHILGKESLCAHHVVLRRAYMKTFKAPPLPSLLSHHVPCAVCPSQVQTRLKLHLVAWCASRCICEFVPDVASSRACRGVDVSLVTHNRSRTKGKKGNQLHVDATGAPAAPGTSATGPSQLRPFARLDMYAHHPQ